MTSEEYFDKSPITPEAVKDWGPCPAATIVFPWESADGVCRVYDPYHRGWTVATMGQLLLRLFEIETEFDDGK